MKVLQRKQAASSCACLTYMSPNSQAHCQRNQAAKRFIDKRKLECYEADIPLDTEQDEISAVVSKIECVLMSYRNCLKKVRSMV